MMKTLLAILFTASSLYGQTADDLMKQADDSYKKRFEGMVAVNEARMIYIRDWLYAYEITLKYKATPEPVRIYQDSLQFYRNYGKIPNMLNDQTFIQRLNKRTERSAGIIDSTTRITPLEWVTTFTQEWSYYQDVCEMKHVKPSFNEFMERFTKLLRKK